MKPWMRANWRLALTRWLERVGARLMAQPRQGWYL